MSSFAMNAGNLSFLVLRGLARVYAEGVRNATRFVLAAAPLVYAVVVGLARVFLTGATRLGRTIRLGAPVVGVFVTRLTEALGHGLIELLILPFRAVRAVFNLVVMALLALRTPALYMVRAVVIISLLVGGYYTLVYISNHTTIFTQSSKGDMDRVLPSVPPEQREDLIEEAPEREPPTEWLMKPAAPQREA